MTAKSVKAVWMAVAVALLWGPMSAGAALQTVTAMPANQVVSPGGSLAIVATYTTDDGDETLTGIGVRMLSGSISGGSPARKTSALP